MKKKCAECESLLEHGHWTSPKHHHCRVCHRTWTGTTQAHCVSCHSHFSSPSAFDAHIVGDFHRRPESVLNHKGEPVLSLRVDKWGRTWSLGDGDTAWWLRRKGLEDMPEPPMDHTRGSACDA